MKTLLKATLIVTIFSLLTRGISFVYRIYLSRMIGSSSLGLYQIVLSVFAVLITVTSSGIPVTVSKQTASHLARGDRHGQFATVTGALIVGLIFSVTISAALFIFRDFFSFLFADKRCMSIFLLLLPAVIASSMYSAFRGGLWGQKSYVAYSITELFEEIVMIVVGVLFLQGIISMLDNTSGAILAISLSYVGGALLTVLLYFMKGGRLASPRGYIKPLLKSALPITGIRIVGSLLSSVVALVLPTVLANSIGMEEALSQYGMMLGMVFPMLFMPSALIGSLALVLVPELSSLSVAGDNKALKGAVGKAINFTLIISFMVVPIFVGMGPELCDFLYGNSIAGKYLSYAAILMVPMGLNQITSTMLNSMGYELRSLKNYLIGSLITLAAVFTLPRYFGILAIIIGDGISVLTTSVLNLIDLNKKQPISLNFLKNAAILVGISIPCIVLSHSMCNLLLNFLPGFFAIGFAGVASCAMLLLLCYLFNMFDISVLSAFFKKKKKKIILKCM